MNRAPTTAFIDSIPVVASDRTTISFFISHHFTFNGSRFGQLLLKSDEYFKWQVKHNYLSFLKDFFE